MPYFGIILVVVLRHRYQILPSNIFKNFAHFKRKMAGHKRYFLNSYPDYKNDPIDSNSEEFKAKLLEYIPKIEGKQPPKKEDTEGGIYVGTPGIAYMFFHLSGLPMFSNHKEEFLKKALNYISKTSRHGSSSSLGNQSGFILGDDGIHAVAAAIYNALGMKEKAQEKLHIFANHARMYKPINFLPYGGDELFVGRAGFVSGAVWLSKIFGKQIVPTEDIIEICTSIYDSGRHYSQRHRSLSPLMYSYYDTEYLGAAHGLCSILLSLLMCTDFMQAKNNDIVEIKRSVDFLLSLQTENGNFPCAMDEIATNARSEENELVHWCHGAPGVVYLMAKAYLIWKDNKYLESCLKCGELVWEKGLLKKGPGICHGVAGSGYVFLLLHRLTGDPKHLYRAQQFAHFLFTPEFKGSRTPDCPYSLYEGLAGTICFIGDLLHPETAAFPFMDIF